MISVARRARCSHALARRNVETEKLVIKKKDRTDNENRKFKVLSFYMISNEDSKKSNNRAYR
jgi:hypothetical protein